MAKPLRKHRPTKWLLHPSVPSTPHRLAARFLFVAARKLEQLNAATILETLRVPPGNRLEALGRDRKGQHSIRINDQWRVCFVWRDDNAFDVEIVDYH
jgi:proteic killer suppression protein